MKKSLIITALCAVALMASCAKVDVKDPAQKAISYEAFNVKPLSKAPITGTVYGYTCPHFGVFSALSAGATATASDTQYFADHEVAPDQTNEIWKPTTTEYWPLSGSLTFMAYTPYNAGTGRTFTPGSKTLAIAGFDITGQDDLMYSKASAATGLTANETDYNPGENQKDTKGVNIVFNHALTQLFIRARLKEAYADATFTIDAITVDTPTTGTLTVAGDAASWGSLNAASAFGIVATYPVSVTATVAPAVAINTVGTMILPVAALNAEQLHVTYSMTYGTSKTSKTVDINIKKAGTVDALEMGKKYVLDLIISANTIEYSPSIAADWTEVAGGDYEVK